MAERGRGETSGGALERHAWVFFVASLAMGAGVVLWNAARSYAAWPNTSDDMFYYLVLARETAAHGVVSVDGVRPTNGFHPLWFLVLRLIQPGVDDAHLPGLALAILGIMHAATSVLLWRTLRRVAGPALAALLAGLYAVNAFLLRVLFAAVESSLAAFLVGICLWAHLRWLEHGRARHRRLALAALMLAVAARTDTVMLAAALGAGAAIARWRATRHLGAALRAVDWAPIAAALVPVLAFGAWSQGATGEFLQTSGRSLSFWQSVGDWRLIRHAVSGLGALATPVAVVGYALEVLVQWVGWITRAPLELLQHHPLGWALGAGLVAAAVLRRTGRNAAHAAKAGGRPAPAPPAGPADTPPAEAWERRLVPQLLTHQLLLWTFYALLFRHCQVWYWHTSVYAAAILTAVWLSPRSPSGAALRSWLGTPWRRPWVSATLLVLSVSLAAVSAARFRPRAEPAVPAAGSAPALDPLAGVPDGATLGAFDTGQLGWEHPRLQVVNLDGLVNNAAYRALRTRRIGQYMLDERVEWLYVRDKVVDRFRAFGLDTWLEAAEPAGRSPDGVQLYRLREGSR